MGKYDLALADAEKCISMKPEFAKGYHRKGLALIKQEKFDEATEVLNKGSSIDPNNQQIKDSLKEIKEAKANLNNPFAKNYSKLYTDPKTSGYMKDPQFVNLLNMAMADQNMLLQLVQKDARFMDVFGVLMGVDLGKMSEEQDKFKTEKADNFTNRKQDDGENKKR